MTNNERIIARISDNTTLNFKGILEGKFDENATIQLQGLKGNFKTIGFKDIVKVEGVKNAYTCNYLDVLEGVKISQLKNYSKIDFAKFIDNEIDMFSAMLDNINVVVKRDNGKVYIIATLSLLVYYA